MHSLAIKPMLYCLSLSNAHEFIIIITTTTTTNNNNNNNNNLCIYLYEFRFEWLNIIIHVLFYVFVYMNLFYLMFTIFIYLKLIFVYLYFTLFEYYLFIFNNI